MHIKKGNNLNSQNNGYWLNICNALEVRKASLYSTILIEELILQNKEIQGGINQTSKLTNQMETLMILPGHDDLWKT